MDSLEFEGVRYIKKCTYSYGGAKIIKCTVLSPCTWRQFVIIHTRLSGLSQRIAGMRTGLAMTTIREWTKNHEGRCLLQAGIDFCKGLGISYEELGLIKAYHPQRQARREYFETLEKMANTLQEEPDDRKNPDVEDLG